MARLLRSERTYKFLVEVETGRVHRRRAAVKKRWWYLPEPEPTTMRPVWLDMRVAEAARIQSQLVEEVKQDPRYSTSVVYLQLTEKGRKELADWRAVRRTDVVGETPGSTWEADGNACHTRPTADDAGGMVPGVPPAGGGGGGGPARS